MNKKEKRTNFTEGVLGSAIFWYISDFSDKITPIIVNYPIIITYILILAFVCLIMFLVKR